MRLWSLHPQHLDAKGLVALWREGLLAQKVLLGQTRGYTRHPQLHRFQATQDPVAAIGTYLRQVVLEADRRGYRFDGAKIAREVRCAPLPVTDGQLAYEWQHLLTKLRMRSPPTYEQCCGLGTPALHPFFTLVPGPVEDWERP